MTTKWQIGDTTRTVQIEQRGAMTIVSVDGDDPHSVEVRTVNGLVEQRISSPEEPDRVLVRRAGVSASPKAVLVSTYGQVLAFTSGVPGSRAKAAVDSGELVSPMVGVVAKTAFSVGDSVTLGVAIVTIEAMKVMAPVEAPFDGVLERLDVQVGDRVTMGQVVAHVAKSEPKE